MADGEEKLFGLKLGSEVDVSLVYDLFSFFSFLLLSLLGRLSLGGGDFDFSGNYFFFFQVFLLKNSIYQLLYCIVICAPRILLKNN